MLDQGKEKKTRTQIWIAIGAIVLIVLLLVWLTFADLTGNTDVAADIPTYLPAYLKL